MATSFVGTAHCENPLNNTYARNNPRIVLAHRATGGGGGDGRNLQDYQYCGDGNVGNGQCFNGECCSSWGWCGTSEEHCSPSSDDDGTTGDEGDDGDGTLLGDWELCSVSSECTNGCCSSQYSDDGQLKCTPLDGGFDSNICVSNDDPTTTGTCGNGDVGDGVCANGQCCSSFGWCGDSPEHCGSSTTNPPSSGTYSIQLDLIGMTPEDQSVFQSAATRWSEIIVEGLTSERTDGLSPPFDGCTFPDTIDNLYICGKVESIDGPGQVLGSAFAWLTHPDSGLTLVGGMNFDAADLDEMRQNGSLQSVILHEMGHVLGIGTLWESRGVTGSDAENCPYTGQNAIREYNALTGCDSLPVEQDGSGGTRCSHFDEECLTNELMTGYVNTGNIIPISRVTIASLQDLGYNGVDYSKADPYSSSDINSQCLCNRRLGGKTKKGNRMLSKKRLSKRKLSAEGYQKAFNYGVELLKSKLKKEKSLPSSDKYTYGGAAMVTVLYMENGNLHDVAVTKNDIN